jgi:hypothetical protein
MKTLFRDFEGYCGHNLTELQLELLRHVERVVVSLSAMISRTISPRLVMVETIADIDSHIKIFLS